MPLFSYKAYDSHGDEQAGLIDASDLGEARKRLLERVLIPFEIELSSSKAADVTGSPGGASFSLGERARLSRQLAALLRGGVPLVRALSGLESQEAWASHRLVLTAVREGIERGRDFSTVLTDIGSIFDPFSLSVIRVGEATGKLDLAFAELATHLNSRLEHRRRLIAALTYPAIMGLTAAGVLTFLLTYLVPMVEKIFSDMHGRLPVITLILIAASDAIRTWGPWALAILLATLILGRPLFSRPEVRLALEGVIFRLPLLGRFLEEMRLEAWARNTSMMARCGVTLLDTVRVARANAASMRERETLGSVEAALVKGRSLSAAMRETGGFSAMIIQMIEAGEASGEVPRMLEEAAGELAADGAARTEMMLNLLEPLLIIAMGFVVGAIMIGVLLPIYEMNRLM
ncbi:MAG: type II secretion system F family protein [Candidatus Riflebacteria bacterium]|nr:type II secretion system F family protein [Candidatus Riflebacteria bacterium]